MTKTDPARGGSKTIGAVERSLAIIEEVKRQDGVGVSELAAALDVSKATAHHHLATLHENGYVVKRDGTYHIGTRFLTFGGFAAEGKPIYRNGRMEADGLAKQTGLPTRIAIEENGRMIYIYQSTSEATTELAIHIGEAVEPHTCAVARALLAPLDRAEVDAVLDSMGVDDAAEYRDEFMADLRGVRDRGIAVDEPTDEPGDDAVIRSVAAPVVTMNGEMLGAICVSGPSADVETVGAEIDLPKTVRTTAGVIAVNAAYNSWIDPD